MVAPCGHTTRYSGSTSRPPGMPLAARPCHLPSSRSFSPISHLSRRNRNVTLVEPADLQIRGDALRDRLDRLSAALGEVIIGQRTVIDAVLIALVAGGHVL